MTWSFSLGAMNTVSPSTVRPSVISRVIHAKSFAVWEVRKKGCLSSASLRAWIPQQSLMDPLSPVYESSPSPEDVVDCHPSWGRSESQKDLMSRATCPSAEWSCGTGRGLFSFHQQHMWAQKEGHGLLAQIFLSVASLWRFVPFCLMWEHRRMSTALPGQCRRWQQTWCTAHWCGSPARRVREELSPKDCIFPFWCTHFRIRFWTRIESAFWISVPRVKCNDALHKMQISFLRNIAYRFLVGPACCLSVCHCCLEGAYQRGTKLPQAVGQCGTCHAVLAAWCQGSKQLHNPQSSSALSCSAQASATAPPPRTHLRC